MLFVNFRPSDSRLGRAWIALREDEVAASSMGIPLVKTKLLAYGNWRRVRRHVGRLPGLLPQHGQPDQFQSAFSIFILAMRSWVASARSGVVVGAIALSFVHQLPADPELRDALSLVGSTSSLTDLSFGIFGFLLVIMMIMRPEGLLPERRRQMELEEVGTASWL